MMYLNGKPRDYEQDLRDYEDKANRTPRGLQLFVDEARAREEARARSLAFQVEWLRLYYSTPRCYDCHSAMNIDEEYCRGCGGERAGNCRRCGESGVKPCVAFCDDCGREIYGRWWPR